jgi:hypothetical protein
MISHNDEGKERMTKFLWTAALLTVTSPAFAAPGDMTLADALTKIDTLMASGSIDPSSPDVTLLIGEVKAAGANYRAQLNAAKAAGTAPDSCPPEKLDLTLDQIIADFQSYPADTRATTTMNVAFANLIRKTHPCKQ